MILRTVSVRAGKICCLAMGQHTVRFDDFALCFRYIVYPAGVDLMTCTEQGFPSCHGVGADNGAIFVRESSQEGRRSWSSYCEAVKSMPLFSGAPRSSSKSSRSCSEATLLKFG